MTTSEQARKKREKEIYAREEKERLERRKKDELTRQKQKKELEQRRLTEKAIQLQKAKRDKDIAAAEEMVRHYIEELEKNKEEK